MVRAWFALRAAVFILAYVSVATARPRGGLQSAEPAGPTAVAAGADLKMTPPSIKVGDRQTKEETTQTSFSVDAGDKKVQFEVTEIAKGSTEVLAVEGNAPSKIKVTYIELKKSQTVMGKTTEKPQPLAGKSYIAWVAGGDVQATAADGSAVTPDELQAVKKRVGKLNEPPVLRQILGGRTWKVGEKYALSADELTRLNAVNGGDGKPNAKEMSLALRSFDAKLALFDMETVLHLEEAGKGSLDFRMKGEVKVDPARAAPLETAMAGTLSGKAQGMPTSGSIKVKVLYTY